MTRLVNTGSFPLSSSVLFWPRLGTSQGKGASMRTMARLLFILLAFALSGAAGRAATRTASTCNANDVQAAINTAVAGDTVVIPAGTCTWTTRVSWKAPSNTVLQGQTTCTGSGAPSSNNLSCTDSTLIIDGLNRSSLGDIPALSITTSSSGTFRLTGITLTSSGGSSNQTYNGALSIDGASQQFRFDHSHLKNINAVQMDIDGQIYGVIDHVLVDAPSGTVYNGIRIEASSWGGGSNNFGDGSWADASTLGSSRFIFVENSTFNNGAANDCTQGGRWVFRYNTFNMTSPAPSLQTHPTGGGARHRGCRAWEAYGNRFNAQSSNYINAALFISSGTGVIWGNTIPSSSAGGGTGYGNLITLHSMRRDNSTYSQSATPNGWGYCGTSFNGTGSKWDQNSNASTGYRCLDQPGQGVGQLMANDFPKAINTATGTISSLNQALEPIYEWLDNYSAVPNNPSKVLGNYETDTLFPNSDYYLYNASFNGTTGVGSGTLAARPSTCTPYVAYWATDTNTLYQCSAANQWKQYYTPYQYPHPLAGSGSSDTQSPTVPQGLSASAASTSEIDLSWTASTDNVGVTGYTIYRNGTKVGTSSITSYADRGLAAATRYTYTVAAYDAAGNNSAQSASTSATTLTQPVDVQAPTTPQNLVASALSSSTISLSWTASSDNVGVAGYTIYRGGVQVGTSTTTSYSDSGLTASTRYTYSVDAFDAAGNNSAQSTSASATTLAQQTDTQPPAVPQNLAASPASSSSISLTWTASTDNVGVTGYTIYRGGVQVGTSKANSYLDTGLPSSTQNSYTVDAFDAAGNHSAQTAPVTATTLAATGAGTPTLVQHVATGMDRYPVTNFKLPLPNPAGAGNALILGIQFRSSGSVSSVTDNKGNTWVAGPTVTNSSTSQRMSLYYALNVAAGTQNVTVKFSGLGNANGYPQAVISEFYNVAQVSAADGSSGSATSRTAGAITTKAAGDLIYHWGVDFSDTNENGGGYNGSSITAGPGFTLLSADLQVGSADQYLIQPAAGTVNPTFTASGSATWGSLALALKSASAGTPPPPGIRIVRVQHTLLNSVRAQGRANPVVMQFPSSGNLLVGLYNSADCLISKVSDSGGNTWASAGSTTGGGGNTQAQIVYAANAATSPNLSKITVSLSGGTQGDNMFNLYDIAGAATSPFDTSATATGVQNNAGNLTTTTITPSTAKGLVLNVVSIDFHTINGIVGSNYVLDSVVNDFDNDDPPNGGPDVSTLDMDNGYSHIYNPTTAALTFVYTYNQATPGGVQNWGSVAAAFKAGSGQGTGVAPPTGLQATPH